MEIELSTGKTNIKKLALFELDDLTPESLGLFTYKTKVLDLEYEIEFNLAGYDEPPTRPTGDIEVNTQAWFDLNDYNLYHAAILHNKRREKTVEVYYERVAKHILAKCIDDVSLIVTEQDWVKVYDAALVKPLTMEKIAEVLHKTYNARFNDQPILEALAGLTKGSGEYNTIRLWENKLMVTMQLTETEYSLLPLDERARKVCTLFIDDMMSYLEMEQSRQKEKSKQDGGSE